MPRRVLSLCALTLAACSAAVPPPRPGYIDLTSQQRAERLFNELHLRPRTLRLQSAELRFIEAGRGVQGDVPWLFIHGLGGNLGDFGPLIVAASRQRRVFAIDLPGFGGSVSVEADYSIPAYVRTLRELASAVEVPRFHLVCHSLGGQVCLGLSLDSPTLVASLTLVDSAGSYDRREFVERLTQGRIGRMHSEHAPLMAPGTSSSGNEVVERLLGNEPTLMASLGSFRQNYRNRVREVLVPTLIVWGSDDPLFPVDYAFFLKENIVGSTLRVVPGAGHEPHLLEPDVVLGWISDFHAGLRRHGE